MVNKNINSRWTPDFILSVVKDVLGSGSLEKSECEDDKVVVKIGTRKSYTVRPSFLDRKEAQRGAGAAIATIVRGLKAIEPNACYNKTIEEEAKDEGKRHLGQKAEAVDAALEMSGSTKKEKDQILKNA